MARPWVVQYRSHQWEWNGRAGSRFATKEAAMKRAQRVEDEGGWDVEVWYSPVPVYEFNGTRISDAPHQVPRG